MNESLKKAKQLLQSDNYTCVLCSGDTVYTSSQRGVRPLISWLEEGLNVRGFSAADKVVGKGAAYLYVLLGVKELYAGVLSDAACKILERYDIRFSCEQSVEAIRNRTNTGFCPMETAVWDIDSPEEALEALKRRLAELARPNQP